MLLSADIDQRSGHLAGAWAHLGAAIEPFLQMRDIFRLHDCVSIGGEICAAAGRWPEALTVWAADKVYTDVSGLIASPRSVIRRHEFLRRAAQALTPDQMRVAEERGAAMTLDTAAEFLLLQTESDSQVSRTPNVSPGLNGLSKREQELVTLVAQGRTDAQIAGQLYISLSTVRSHLDRIRDKTSCRRRADLTRMAQQAGLA
jgi:DNA-binding CsgD family transcriptional regulator